MHPYLKAGDSPRKAVVVLTSNRGLAGGYNSNIVKLITHGDFKKEELDIYAVGAKGEALLTSKGYHIVESASEMMEDPTYEDAAALCKRVLKAFTDGQVGEIYLAYTEDDVRDKAVAGMPSMTMRLPAGTQDISPPAAGAAPRAACHSATG